MNPHTIKRLFPNCSASVLSANAHDYAKPNDNPHHSGQAAELERDMNLGTASTIEEVWSEYLKEGSVHRAGSKFGISGDAAWKALKAAGKSLNSRRWSVQDIEDLKIAYSSHPGDLGSIAATLHRTYAAISCKADELGLTQERGKYHRTESTRAKYSEGQKERASRPGERERRSKALKEAWKRNGHPRGALGMKLTEEHKQKLKAAAAAARADASHVFNSKAYRQKLSDRFSKLARERRPENCYSRTKSGWIELGGKRFFARSKWEANYARFLEFLKLRGEIVEWEHEPETFWFEKIRRGVRSYLPDFRVTSIAGKVEYHEVKGWMDAKSKTKIKRMAKYYPSVVLLIRGEAWFRSESKMLRNIVPGWQK